MPVQVVELFVSVPGSPATNVAQDDEYQFKFNGCPRGPAVSAASHRGAVALGVCKALCSQDPACNAIAVNGCVRDSAKCGGACYTFSAWHSDRSSIVNGNCSTNGDQRAYAKVRTPRGVPGYALDFAPTAAGSGSEYELQVATPRARAGEYVLSAWVKYDADYDGNRTVLHSTWWDGSGVLGSTRVGTPAPA